MAEVYFGVFESREDVEKEFQVQIDSSLEILFAIYEYENYSGDAYVLLKSGNSLFEVHGGHCSCYGLEGQWSPEETSLAAIEHIRTKGNHYSFNGNSIPSDRFAEIVEGLK